MTTRPRDRGADLVVRGESAEAELDRFAGGGSGRTAVQRHDSPGHIAIGNSVCGDDVVIHGIAFSPGELAALTGYIGDIASLRSLEERFTPDQTRAMKRLLERGIDGVLPWDPSHRRRRPTRSFSRRPRATAARTFAIGSSSSTATRSR